ncbi:MAG: Uma2 family endonuclease [Armatimonadota bacterium]|nr:Uma2 family endonuclease [Armatimonadota bacterium]
MTVRAKVWTRDEYERLVRAGAFDPGSRVQLVQGEIVEMTPQSAAHAAAVELVQRALLRLVGPEQAVRVQMPLALGADSEPEPDLAVVAGDPRSRTAQHPTTAALVVEVADTTLEFDRTRKLALYARAMIPEYWIVNLVDRVLEVYRDPLEGTYRTIRRLGAHDRVVPLCALGPLVVADLLP